MNYRIVRDINGNRRLRVSPDDGERGFSVQTLGNMPLTHRAGIGSYTQGELHGYVKRFGTERQRELLGCY